MRGFGGGVWALHRLRRGVLPAEAAQPLKGAAAARAAPEGLQHGLVRCRLPCCHTVPCSPRRQWAGVGQQLQTTAHKHTGACGACLPRGVLPCWCRPGMLLCTRCSSSAQSNAPGRQSSAICWCRNWLIPVLTVTDAKIATSAGLDCLVSSHDISMCCLGASSQRLHSLGAAAGCTADKGGAQPRQRHAHLVRCTLL